MKTLQSVSLSMALIGMLLLSALAVVAITTNTPITSTNDLMNVYGDHETVVLSREVINSPDIRWEIEEYHESDSWLGVSNDDTYIVYLNRTSPICDTVYVYHFLE